MTTLPTLANPSPLALDLGPQLIAMLDCPLCPLDGEGPEAHARRLETALMVLFRETGSEAVFTALYQSTRDEMAAWIQRMSRGRRVHRDRGELLQDTYVNIYRYAGSFRDGAGGGFRGWARTIAANVVRRSTVRRGALLTLGLPEGGAEPVDPKLGPQGLCSRAEEQSDLQVAYGLLLLHYAEAFKSLSPRDQEALTMVEVDGLSYTEAGRLLRVGRSNMKMIMFRARKRIRAHVLAAMAQAGEASGSQSLRAVG